VHLGNDPEPLSQFLGPLVTQLAPYRFAEMNLVADQTCRLNCNWKAVIDNFGELYHVDFLHPQHRSMVDCENDTVHLFANGHTGVHVPGATVSPRFPLPKKPTPILAAQLAEVGLAPETFIDRVPEIRGAIAARKRALGQADGNRYAAFTDDQLTDAWQYNLFPNIVLSFGVDYIWIMRARPHAEDPGRTDFDKLTLARQPMATRPVRDEFDYAAVIRGDKSMTITIDQDVSLLKDVQRGMQSAGFDTVWLSEEEARVQHFHAEWERRMGS
jgi:phenylpropionate dioxygenase-like ring-hydroxylating dioxygenase large terminal subunit